MAAASGSSGRERSRSPRRDEQALRPGLSVRLHGLKAAASLNGATGTLEELIAATGRWRVKLASGESKDLKPENLEVQKAEAAAPGADSSAESRSLVAGARVRLRGLQRAPELNGQAGVLEALIAATGRWRVKLDSGGCKDLKPENLSPEAKPEASTSAASAERAPQARKLVFAGGSPTPLCAVERITGLVFFFPPLSVIMGRSRSRSGGRAEKKRARSSSESGTPDWLRKRRQNGSRVPDGGSGGGGYGGGDKGKGKGKGEVRPGDWSCPQCGTNVFASKDSCFKCGYKKSSGSGGGDRGRGRSRDRYRSRSRGRR